MKKEANKVILYSHKKPAILTISLFLTLGIILVTLFTEVSAEQYSIPLWVKNTAKWWGDGQIGDSDFVNGLQWLIQNKIMILPQEKTSQQSNGTQIPNWVKTTAKLWGHGQIGDSDFVHGIQYLIDARIINIATPSTQTTSAQTSSNLSAGLDRFGITELNPTIPGGREWFSSWDNGIARTVKAVSRDPSDPMFMARGDAKIMIDGQGIANMTGKNPRMYVYDKAKLLKWRNVEATFYGKRISDFSGGKSSPAGFNIGARSNHQDQGNPSNCNVDTYYSRILYNGNANFLKELYHPDEGARLPLGNTINWGGNNTVPYNQWIGHKFVLRDVDNGTHVQLEMYLDLTGGMNGGDWKLVAQIKDDGNWTVPPNPCGIPQNKIILEDNPSVFIRNTNINSTLYKKFSIREISPLP